MNYKKNTKNLKKSFHHLIIFSFLTIINPALAKSQDYTFQILKREAHSSSPVNIGEAHFKEEILTYDEKKVIRLVVNISFSDLGRVRSEIHEAIGYKENYNMVYTRYQDSQKSVSSKKNGDNVSLTLISNNSSTSINHATPSNSIPSVLVYLKLSSAIGAKSEVDYIAYNENEFSRDKLVSRGRAVYKGLQEVSVLNKKEKLHVFLNSLGQEKSIVYYDANKNLRAIEFVYVGQSIVFLRNK